MVKKRKLNTSPAVYTVGQAAKVMKVASTTIHYFIALGKLTKYTMKGLQEVFVSQHEVSLLHKKRVKEGRASK